MKARALLLLPESPYPPTCGNAVRDVQQVALLRRLGYDVTLLCVRPRIGNSAQLDREEAVRSGVSIQFVAQEACDQRETMGAALLRKIGYLSSQNSNHPFAWWSIPYALRTAIPQQIAEIAPAFIVVRSLFVDLLPVLREKFAGAIVTDCHDADVHLAHELIRSVPWWKRPGPWANYRGVYTVYRRYLQLADEMWVVSIQDAGRIQPFAGLKPVLVVPSAVDENEIAAAAEPGCDDVCAMVANYGYGPNLNGARWLVKEVWPRVRCVRPTARLLLVGGRAEDKISEMVAGATGIIVTGRVEDLRPIYAEVGVMLAPLHQGGGSRLKIVEAWKHGKAVVTTRKGVEGLDCPPTVAAVRDEPAAFAHALAELLGDGRQRLRLGDASRRFVRERLSYASVEQRLATQSVISGERQLQGRPRVPWAKLGIGSISR